MAFLLSVDIQLNIDYTINTTNTITKQYISTAELAKILGVSRVAVFNLIKNGQIKAKKSGRNYFIDVDSVPALSKSDVSLSGKRLINKAVEKVVAEYGETIRLLGQE